MRAWVSIFVLLLLWTISLSAQPGQGKSAKQSPVLMENYYKVKWGHQEDFLKLFKKNHLPFLRDLMKTGEVISVKMEKPAEHGTEDGRWDFRVTIIFRDLESAFGDKSGDDAILKCLFPDQATFVREEQQRFELLLAHWDVRIETVKID
jgi:hypothetical protein